MGSKMRFPDPYPYRQPGGRKNYILVVNVKKSEVIRFVEAPSLHNLNKGIQGEIAKKLTDKWLELSRKYRSPEYDIISLIAGGIKEICGIFGIEDGLKGAKKETISL